TRIREAGFTSRHSPSFEKFHGSLSVASALVPGHPVDTILVTVPELPEYIPEALAGLKPTVDLRVLEPTFTTWNDAHPQVIAQNYADPLHLECEAIESSYPAWSEARFESLASSKKLEMLFLRKRTTSKPTEREVDEGTRAVKRLGAEILTSVFVSVDWLGEWSRGEGWTAIERSLDGSNASDSLRE
ncbi:hypothetical protein FRB90_002958, partial [Tulasnella sp. 427]